ncbi:MAG TPA: peptidoglycan editing factor PgeF [Burkholderiaceae bacterium]|jgi:YfiH family protein|nr:peptidoglycan editing factor PgeF [Burkholderiaceae bacterium]
MSVIYPVWDAPTGIGALSTTRLGGVSAAPYDDGAGGGGLNLGTHVGDNAQDVEANRSLLRQLLPASPIWLSQVHGTRVVDAADAVSGTEADAIIATQPGQVCTIMTADCLPVLFCDVAGKVVGAAHAGWRGLAGGVLENTVACMRAAGAEEIIAWMGPAIGPTRFEVGAEVVAAFADHDAQAVHAFQAIPERAGKYLADIYALARLRLQSVGVRRISGGDLCTVTEPNFYSYRRDGVTGRMASLVWIKVVE